MSLSDITDALGITGGSGSGPPPVTRPTASVSFGGGGGGGDGGALAALGDAVGGLGGGVAGAAASALGLGGGGGGDDPWARAMVSVRVDLRAAPGVDAVEVVVSAASDAPSVAVGDAGTVAFDAGSGGGSVTVFTGEVERVDRSNAWGTRLVATNGSAALAALRVDQSYEQRSAGQMVTDLAGRAGASTGTIEDGIDLPVYVADGSRSAWAHVAALAARCGFLAVVTGDGDLAFGPIDPGSPVRTFTAGQDIVAIRGGPRRQLVGSVTVVGEGAAGSNGADAASWLVKDPGALRTTSGKGDQGRLRSDPVVRSAGASTSASGGLATLAGLSDAVLHVLVTGAPEVRPGTSVTVAGAGDGLDGTYLVVGVRHRYAHGRGFDTALDLGLLGAGAGGGSQAGGGLLGAAASAVGGLL
jgi:hypothetical protein